MAANDTARLVGTCLLLHQVRKCPAKPTSCHSSKMDGPWLCEGFFFKMTVLESHVSLLQGCRAVDTTHCDCIGCIHKNACSVQSTMATMVKLNLMGLLTFCCH